MTRSAELDVIAQKAAWCLENGASGESADIFQAILDYRAALSNRATPLAQHNHAVPTSADAKAHSRGETPSEGERIDHEDARGSRVTPTGVSNRATPEGLEALAMHFELANRSDTAMRRQPGANDDYYRGKADAFALAEATVRADWGKVYEIGHFIEDRWFSPERDLAHLTSQSESSR